MFDMKAASSPHEETWNAERDHTTIPRIPFYSIRATCFRNQKGRDGIYDKNPIKTHLL